MKNKAKTVKIACQNCDSTGLHVGSLETKGTATICTTCKGKGYVEATYEPFVARKHLTGIKKIFESAFGCKIFQKGEATYELEDETQIVVNFNDYECCYKDWKENNKSPILLTQLSCPYIHSSQNYEVATLMECSKNADLDLPIGCWSCYKDREKCWNKYIIKTEE